jgi:small subunit ribosomal protein S6
VNVYENIAILDASLSDEDTEALIQKIRDVMTANGAEVLKADNWGRRRMAYEINKHVRGTYVLFLLQGQGALVKNLEDFYKVTDGVVKYLIVRLEKKQREATLKALTAAAEAAAAPPAEEGPAETPAATVEAPEATGAGAEAPEEG